MLSRQLRVTLHHGFHINKAERLFRFNNRLLFALDLHKKSERQSVKHNFNAPDAPRLAPLLINERRSKAERIEDVRHRFPVFNERLIFTLMLDRGRRRKAFLVSQNRTLTHAP